MPLFDLKLILPVVALSVFELDLTHDYRVKYTLGEARRAKISHLLPSAFHDPFLAPAHVFSQTCAVDSDAIL